MEIGVIRFDMELYRYIYGGVLQDMQRNGIYRKRPNMSLLRYWGIV